MKTILLTGSAGFIGSNLMKKLLLECKDCALVGFDNCNDYYDVSLKEYRLKELENIKTNNTYRFVKGDLADRDLINDLFDKYHLILLLI